VTFRLCWYLEGGSENVPAASVRRFQWYLNNMDYRLKVNAGAAASAGLISPFGSVSSGLLGVCDARLARELASWLDGKYICTTPLVRLSLGGVSNVDTAVSVQATHLFAQRSLCGPLLAHFGKECKSEVVIPKIRQKSLAEMVGTTQLRVSFFMNKFRALGFVAYDAQSRLQVHSSLLNIVLHRASFTNLLTAGRGYLITAKVMSYSHDPEWAIQLRKLSVV